jgi:two-component system chemotaxis response regulator CheY
MDKNITILVVDDYEVMRRFMRKQLARLGFETVEEAGSGQEALEQLKTNTIDLVITDWNMTPVSGIQLLREVKSNRFVEEVPFIIMTGDQRSVNEREAKMAGIDRILIKAQNMSALNEMIQEALAHRVAPAALAVRGNKKVGEDEVA